MLKFSVGSFLFVLFAAKIRDEFSPFSSAINLSFTLVPHSSSPLAASFSENPKLEVKTYQQRQNQNTRNQQLLLNCFFVLSLLPAIDIPVATRRNEKSTNTVLDLEHNILSLFFSRLFLFFVYFLVSVFLCLMES